MRLTRTRGWLAGIALVVALGAYAMLRPEVQRVETGAVTRGPLQVTIDEDARTRMLRHTEVAAPVTGRLGEGLVRAGDMVSRGATLAVMYPAPLDPRSREEATAGVNAAQWLRREAASRVQQTRIALDAARREESRARQLAAAGAIAPRELEEATDLLAMRRRDLDAAIAAERAAAEDERRARSSLISSGTSGQTGRVTVRAPMSGRVLRVMEEHDRVVPAGTPILSIGDPASLELVIPVRTVDAQRVDAGAEILVRIGSDSAVAARVARIEPGAFTKVSPLGVEEQRVNVIGRFAVAPAGLGDEFAVGSSIVVWRADDVLKVPASALVAHDGGWAVFVVSDKRARLRLVSLGERGTTEAEVRSGLRVGEVVVLYPESELQDGARVAAR